MVVAASGAIAGTVGGGTLEHDLIGRAVAMMGDAPAGLHLRHVLGPDLGQCCGGVVKAAIEVFGPDDLGWIAPLAEAEAGAARITTHGLADDRGRLVRRLSGAGLVETFGLAQTPVMLFGAGHVGKALVMALAPLPFAVEWVDPRAEAFPAAAPGNVRMRCLADPVMELAHAPPASLIVVMTHSHALDLALVSAALSGPFGYVGLIGSLSKRARFVSRLAQAGLGPAAEARLVCPIAGGLLADKHPAVIAAAVAMELLQQRERLQATG